MSPRNGSRRDAVAAGYSVGEFSNAAEPSQQPRQPQAKIPGRIRVRLVGSNRAEAFGLVAVSHAPLCALCRTLIRAGFNPDLRVEAYRGGTLALRCKSLLVAAQLTA